MQLSINGMSYETGAGANDVLLWVLRDELRLTGTKYGCGVGICGACTVHLDGQPVRACVTPLEAVQGKVIRTIEGLAEGDTLHPVQQAFLEFQVPQCGWCMSGQIMLAAALLEVGTETAGMSANYCRCGAYPRIRKAVARAAELMGGEQ